MTKVIQIRGVPDDVHAKLVDAATRAGKSLTAFVGGELEELATRLDSVEHNRRVLAALRDEIGVADIPRDVVRGVIEEGREERIRQVRERHLREGA